MGKARTCLLVLLFIAGSVPGILAQDIHITITGEEKYEDAPGVFVPEEPQAQIEPGFVGWAWDIPESHYRQYPITQYNYWMQAKGPVGGGIRVLHYRDRNEMDDFHLSGYAFFRPLAIELEHSHLSIGVFGAFDAFWSEENFYMNSLNPENRMRKRGIPNSAGVSILWSVPAHGLQFVFEAGHFWARTRYQFPEITVTHPLNPAIVLPGYGRIRRIQSETGVSVFFSANWVAERNFLYGLGAEFMGSFRTGPRTLTAKLKHPLLGEFDLPPTSGFQQPTRIDYVTGIFFLKLLNFSLGDIPSLGLTKYNVISIEPAGMVGHFTNDNGHTLGAGCRMRIFGALGVNYLHTWEVRNEAYDADIFALEVGFQFGRSAIRF